MVKIKFSKKGAELPLNAIVIALLVIIVLVVIITFFIGRIGDAGDDLDNVGEGVNACEVGSYAIPEDEYSDADWAAPDSDGNVDCGEWVRIYTVPKKDDGSICCAEPN